MGTHVRGGPVPALSPPARLAPRAPKRLSRSAREVVNGMEEKAGTRKMDLGAYVQTVIT